MSQNTTTKRLTVDNSTCLFGQTIIGGTDPNCGSFRVRTDAFFEDDIYTRGIKSTNDQFGLVINGIRFYNGGDMDLNCDNLTNINGLECETLDHKTTQLNVHSLLNFTIPGSKIMWDQGMKIGDINTTTSNTNSIAIGKNTRSGDDTVSIGNNAGTETGVQNVNVGKNAGNMSTGLQNINLGQNTNTINDSAKAITIGCDAVSAHNGAIVIGPGISGSGSKLHLNFLSGGSVVATNPTLPRQAFLTICVNGKKFQMIGYMDGCYNPTMAPFSLMPSGSPISSQNPLDPSMQRLVNFVDKYNGPDASTGGFLIQYSAPGESTAIPSISDCPTDWTPTLDTTYNTNAQIVGADIPFVPYPTKAISCSVIDNAGKMLVAENWNIYRFNTNGLLDNTFGTSGVTDLSVAGFATPDTPQIDEAPGWHMIIVHPVNGTIFVVGSCIETNGPTRIIVRKLTSNGLIDNTFGTNGSYIDTQSYFTVGYALAFTSTYDIVVAGFDGFYGSVGRHMIMKITSTGVLDTSFGASGYARIPFVSNFPEGELRGVAVQPDGKIVAGGYFSTGVGGNFRAGYGVMRVDANGTIDPSYGENSGWTIYYPNVFDAYAYTANYINSEMYVGGYQQIAGATYISGIVKFNTNGLRDLSWQMNGTRYSDLGLMVNTNVYDIVDDCSGGLFVCGSTNSFNQGNTTGSFVYRLDNTGALDSNWGTGGIYIFGSPTFLTGIDIYETSSNVEIYCSGWGPVGNGLNGTITRFLVPKPPVMPTYTYEYNYVPGLRIYDFSNAILQSGSMYDVPYSMYNSININPNPTPECPLGWHVTNTPIKLWTDANNIVLVNNNTTFDVSWDPVIGAEKYAISVTVVGVASAPITHYYGKIVNAPTISTTLDTTQTGNTTSFWGSISSVTARVVGYAECDTSLQPAERCLNVVLFNVTGSLIETINYALASNGGTATATSTGSSLYGSTVVTFSASRAIDGLLDGQAGPYSGHWAAANFFNGATLTVNLGSIKNISIIRVFNGLNQPVNDCGTNAYRLGISTDNINYTIVQTSNLPYGNVNTPFTTTFPEAPAQYVRFYVDSYYSNRGALGEIRVSTKQLHITATSGTIQVGYIVTGPGVLPGTYITGQISGTPGGTGYYSLNQYPIGSIGPALTISSNWGA